MFRQKVLFRGHAERCPWLSFRFLLDSLIPSRYSCLVQDLFYGEITGRGEINDIGQHLGICNYYVPHTYTCIDKITDIVNLVLINSCHSQEFSRTTVSYLYFHRLYNICAVYSYIYDASRIWMWKGSRSRPQSSIMVCIRTSYVLMPL